MCVWLVSLVCAMFFVFKQKTAYEMRISDWSSDVCSSDLPEPVPPPALRPTTISVTEVDRLKADPYAFYARRVLRLMPLDAVDADPSAAWRGTVVHRNLEIWKREDEDRKSVVEGKRGAVRENLGGRRVRKKKKTEQTQQKRKRRTT